MKLRESFDFLPVNTLDPNFRDKCNQLIAAFKNFRKHENIQYLNTRSAENFLTYFDVAIKKATYNDLPENCMHIKISYYTYTTQDDGNKDPTSISRKIKKMYIMVK